MVLDAVVYCRGVWYGIKQCTLRQGAPGVGSVGVLGSAMVIDDIGRRMAGGYEGG